MLRLRSFLAAGLCTGLFFAAVAPCCAADDKPDDLTQMVIDLLGDKDKDLRSVGLEQVRTAAKGTAPTTHFASRLAKLPVDLQPGLLSALADRGDAAARPAVLELLAGSKAEPVRVAAIAALGSLGSADDLDLLIKLLAQPSAAEQSAARSALSRLRGDAISKALAAALSKSSPPVRIALLEVLTTRRTADTMTAVVPLAVDDDPAVRAAAMAALGQLAGPAQIPGMLAGVLKAASDTERIAAEKAVVLVCSRIEDAGERVQPVIAAWQSLKDKDQNALLSTIGRIGGAKALAVVEKAMAGPETARKDAGLAALCLWPDATVADKLFALAKQAQTPAVRNATFSAFVRVGSLRDGKRTDQERLDRMLQAMEIAQSPTEKTLVINRCRSAYIIEAFRYIVPFLDQPAFAQIACESIVEMAHNRELRQPNKAEFDKALDKVLVTTKDAVLIERSNRYKNGQTWERPKARE